MSKCRSIIFGLGLLSIAASGALAAEGSVGRVVLDRDSAYEADLQWQSSVDKIITPSRVIRWLKAQQGQTLIASNSTEFLPIVTTNNNRYRIIAAIAYRF